MLVTVRFPGIVALIKAKADEWDAMTGADRAKAASGRNRDDPAFRFLAGIDTLETAILDVIREKRFKGLRTVKAEGSVSASSCVAALGRKKNPPRLLGKGSFGEVYEHPGDPSRVLKVVTCVRTDPDSAVREAEIMKRASAAGVSPKFYGTRVCCGKGPVATRCLAIFELGRLKTTLVDWVQEKPRSRSEKIKMIKRIDAKLQKLHGMGIRHMDIHLENVMVDSKGQPFLIDFGEAKDSTDPWTDFPGLVQEMSVWMAREIMRDMKETRFDHDETSDMVDYILSAISARSEIVGLNAAAGDQK